MAPEVLQGSDAHARSDIFSFGCVLYEMITGCRAFEGKSQFSVLGAILDKEPDRISAVQPSSPATAGRNRVALPRKESRAALWLHARCKNPAGSINR